MLASTATTSSLLRGNNRIYCMYNYTVHIQQNLEKIYLLQNPTTQHVLITCIVTHINCSTLTALSASHDPYTHPHI